MQRRLATAGIDQSKTLAEVALEAGIGEEKIRERQSQPVLTQNRYPDCLIAKHYQMVMPKVDLPAELRKAERVTALSHPRWGQMFLAT